MDIPAFLGVWLHFPEQCYVQDGGSLHLNANGRALQEWLFSVRHAFPLDSHKAVQRGCRLCFSSTLVRACDAYMEALNMQYPVCRDIRDLEEAWVVATVIERDPEKAERLQARRDTLAAWFEGKIPLDPPLSAEIVEYQAWMRDTEADAWAP